MNPVTRALLSALTFFDLGIKRTYQLERRIQSISLRPLPNDPEYTVWDQEVMCDGHHVPVRLFAPKEAGPSSLLIFFHGGGWVTGGIENYTGVCLNLTRATGHTVALVDYRLAPEHKFPASVEDCYAVTKAFFTGHVPGVVPDDITLIGDSAGGNLTAAVSLMARDRGEFMPQRQIMLYPVTAGDHSDSAPFPSLKQNANGYLLTTQRVRDVVDMYESSPADRSNPYFAPLCATDFSHQPRTLMITAEFCPLRDEGERYGQKLLAAGGDVTIVRMKNAIHAYMMLPPSFRLVRRTHKLIRSFLETPPQR